MTLQEMIEKYETLSESEQAHVDAACDSLDEGYGNECVCGETDCPEEYAHMTGGF